MLASGGTLEPKATMETPFTVVPNCLGSAIDNFATIWTADTVASLPAGPAITVSTALGITRGVAAGVASARWNLRSVSFKALAIGPRLARPSPTRRSPPQAAAAPGLLSSSNTGTTAKPACASRHATKPLRISWCEATAALSVRWILPSATTAASDGGLCEVESRALSPTVAVPR